MYNNLYQLIYLQENPKPNKCLGIFGLSVYTTEHQLYDIFAKYGSIDKILIIIDAKVSRLKFNINIKVIFMTNMYLF